MKVEIELDIPEELLDQATRAAIRQDAVLRLFEARKIPGGQAARLLGLTRAGFEQLARERGIAVYDYTFADWQGDTATVEKIWPEIERNLR